MSTEISLGFQLYSVAKMLHQAIFINGTLVNMETWPFFTENRLVMFERVEQGLFRKVLKAHSKTPIESLYLELGVLPFRFHLMMRRISYFHEIMMRDDDELTKKVVLSQMERRTKGDFYQQVEVDLQALGINEGEVLAVSKSKLKDLLKKKASISAFQYLIEMARSHSKVNEKAYSNLEGMDYMNDPRFTPDLVNMLFKFRTRMFNVRNNFRNNYKQTNTLCPLCEVEEDSQQHLFHCSVIHNQTQRPTTAYEDIFSIDSDTLLMVAKDLKGIVAAREELESELVADDDAQSVVLDADLHSTNAGYIHS